MQALNITYSLSAHVYVSVWERKENVPSKMTHICIILEENTQASLELCLLSLNGYSVEPLASKHEG